MSDPNYHSIDTDTAIGGQVWRSGIGLMRPMAVVVAIAGIGVVLYFLFSGGERAPTVDTTPREERGLQSAGAAALADRPGTRGSSAPATPAAGTSRAGPGPDRAAGRCRLLQGKQSRQSKMYRARPKGEASRPCPLVRCRLRSIRAEERIRIGFLRCFGSRPGRRERLVWGALRWKPRCRRRYRWRPRLPEGDGWPGSGGLDGH